RGVMTNTITRGVDYTYQIAGSNYDFYTGQTSDGLQLLVVIQLPRFLVITFDQKGNLVNVNEMPLADSTVSAAKYGSHAALSGTDGNILQLFQDRGVVLGPIRVKLFFLSQYDVGIKDFPDYFQSILSAPHNYSADEYDIATQELERWSHDGLFDLWLNNGVRLTINREGVKESS